MDYPAEQQQLRGMSEEDRFAWFNDNRHLIRSASLWTIKVAGVLVATGPDTELPLMYDEFVRRVMGPPLVAKQGGMG